MPGGICGSGRSGGWSGVSGLSGSIWGTGAGWGSGTPGSSGLGPGDGGSSGLGAGEGCGVGIVGPGVSGTGWFGIPGLGISDTVFMSTYSHNACETKLRHWRLTNRQPYRWQPLPSARSAPVQRAVAMEGLAMEVYERLVFAHVRCAGRTPTNRLSRLRGSGRSFLDRFCLAFVHRI